MSTRLLDPFTEAITKRAAGDYQDAYFWALIAIADALGALQEAVLAANVVRP